MTRVPFKFARKPYELTLTNNLPKLRPDDVKKLQQGARALPVWSARHSRFAPAATITITGN